MLSTLMWLTLALVILATQGYTIMARFLRLLLHTYFRKIEVYGLNNFPREGPVILCPNHPNMLVDAILVMTEAIIQGRNPYVWAKGSLFSNPVASFFLKKAGAVPVYRPRRKETSLADVDSDKTPEELEAANRAMFEHTWGVLADNNVMVLFPEGTSYTAPKMLSLRTGVVRVATGFAKHFDRPIPIIPLGLNYFSKDHFRSQMTLEFGPPMVITPELVHSDVFQQDEHREVKRLTHDLEERMHDLTLNASDFTIIHAARMMRRLYLSTPGTIDALKEVRLTQFIIRMLEAKPENEEQKDRIKRTCEKVLQYKEQLEKLRLKDQEVNQSMPNEQSLIKLFFERILYLLVLLPLATPGLLLNFPYYFIGKKLNRLAGFVESKSMFKIFAAGVLVPVHWLVLILATWFFFGSSYAYVLAVGLPLLLYSHIRVLEESRSIAENVYFLFNIATHAEQVSALRKERELLARDVHTLVESFVDANFLSALHKSIAISPVNRRFYHRTSSISDSLLAR
ncbi:putative phospholipid/glycerol acyltransferase [Plasmopara halstedii]